MRLTPATIAALVIIPLVAILIFANGLRSLGDVIEEQLDKKSCLEDIKIEKLTDGVVKAPKKCDKYR